MRKLMRVRLDRKLWRRGKKGSKLLMQYTEQKCCIGFLALKLGATEKQIRGAPTMGDIYRIPLECERFYRNHTNFLTNAYHINDTPHEDDDASRVKSLNRAAIDAKVPVRFYLGR